MNPRRLARETIVSSLFSIIQYFPSRLKRAGFENIQITLAAHLARLAIQFNRYRQDSQGERIQEPMPRVDPHDHPSALERPPRKKKRERRKPPQSLPQPTF